MEASDGCSFWEKASCRSDSSQVITLPQTPLNLSQVKAVKKRLTQCQWHHLVNKATKGVRPLRLPAGRAAQVWTGRVRAAEHGCKLPEREGRERISSVLILPFVKQHVENDLNCELFAELDSVLFHSLAET